MTVAVGSLIILAGCNFSSQKSSPTLMALVLAGVLMSGCGRRETLMDLNESASPRDLMSLDLPPLFPWWSTF
jgi:hypothetical protein